MNDMIKAEREKIISRKPTKILFIMGIILIAAYFFLFQFGYTSIFYNYDTGKMDTVSGFAAIEQRKENADIFAGELTSEILTLMEQKIAEAKIATDTKDENSASSALHVYRDQKAILEYMTEPDGKMKSITEAYPNHESVILGYCDGWDKMLSSMGSILAILLCLLVVITLSPVFSEEYSCHIARYQYKRKNKVPMAELKQGFEKLNYTEVKTYLNSGNVIFSSDEADTIKLTSQIEEMIKNQFSLNIPVFIISKEELEGILHHAPDWWGDESKEIYDNLIFIMPPATFKDVYNEIGEPKEGLEKIEEYKETVFWSFSRKDYQKTNWWSKTASANISSNLTIRTANTVRKIISM